MPRLPFRAATPALITAGLIVGMVAATGAALPAFAQSTDATATASTASTAVTVSAPLSTINAGAALTLADAQNALEAARTVAADIRSSGLEIASDSTSVDTSTLSEFIDKLGDLHITPLMLVPALTADAAAEVQLVRESTAQLRGQLDAAIQKKAEEEAAAEAAAAQAAAEAAAAEAAAKAEAEAAKAAQVASVAAVPSVDVNVDPASAQGIARDMAAANYGWGDDEFACLVALWNRESGWNAAAYNASSGAYGIPQALPGSKMSSAGADWQTNPATQIAWGLGYISGRYGTACGAWNHSQTSGWY